MVFSKKIETASDKALEMCKEIFAEIEKIEEYNQQKVLKSFIKNEISESHFVETTGYGYNDRGREKLDKVFADIFECEDALVRHNFVSGTHTLSTALFGILRPKDKVLCVTGIPYDTLSNVINSKGKNYGSLNDFDIDFEYIDYNKNEDIYFKNIKNKLLKNKYKLLYIQRSRGYTLRDSLSSKKIGKIIEFAKSIDNKIITMVDNCYGEFAEKHEPTHFGADLIAGSLIKNPGGGIAVSGGYIVGKKKFVEQCAYRLTAPGIGKEIGANFGVNRSLFMGILNAPHVVAEAKKTAVFAAALFNILGYEVYPKYDETRCDIVQSIVLQKPESLINFCKGIQSASPIDSFVSPEPWNMPGYANKIIMAAGTFISGSSIELSADGPLKNPYTVWVQGGTNFYCSKLGIMNAAENVEVVIS